MRDLCGLAHGVKAGTVCACDGSHINTRFQAMMRAREMMQGYVHSRSNRLTPSNQRGADTAPGTGWMAKPPKM